MNSRQAYLETRAALQAAGIPDAGFDAGVLLRQAAGVGRLDEVELTAAQAARLEGLVARRLEREPLQYIVGRWGFMNLNLFVGSGVLAPRPDTECVCEAAIEMVRGLAVPRVLDLCSGSGALALGVADAVPGARVEAVELYPEAFLYLCRNLAAFRGPAWVTARRADALRYHERLCAQGLDLLVCNPPYVTGQEYAGLAPEVHREPKTALVAGEGGLGFYRAIAREYRAAVKPGGALVFEIGAAQGAAVGEILECSGWRDVEIRKDYGGHVRLALAVKPV